MCGYHRNLGTVLVRYEVLVEALLAITRNIYERPGVKTGALS